MSTSQLPPAPVLAAAAASAAEQPRAALDALAAKLRAPRSAPSAPDPRTQPLATRTVTPPASPPPAPAAPAETVPARFVPARKRIVSPKQLQRWEHSDACRELLAWITACNEAVVGRSLRDDVETSKVRAVSRWRARAAGTARRGV
jgi:hypothetical protein